MAESTNNTTSQNNSQSDEVAVELVDKVSKAGNPYTALQVTIGEYQAMIFPSPIEKMYIEHILENSSK